MWFLLISLLFQWLQLMWFDKMSNFKWLCLPVLHDFVVDLAASSMHVAASARVAHLLQPATKVFICGAQLLCSPNFPGGGNLAIPTKWYWIQPLSIPVCHYGFIYYTNFYLQKNTSFSPRVLWHELLQPRSVNASVVHHSLRNWSWPGRQLLQGAVCLKS